MMNAKIKGKKEQKLKYRKYIKMALKMGAQDALVIKTSNIIVDPRVLLKCMYGCKGWNSNWMCPSAPGALRPWEFADIIKRYSVGILIRTNDKKLSQDISYKVEINAFWDGYYLAWGMSDCAICKECAYPTGKCRFPMKARPAMQGVGIDVYATVRKQGLPIKPLRTREETPNWYSLVLIE